jgi:RecB family exonuclease
MTNWVATTTEDLQAKVVAEADEQTLILTSGGRLARQLRHAFRLDRIKKGQSGWLPPKVLSLNAWIEETWRSSWPEETPASPIKIIELWEKSVQMLDLPEGLTADIPLYQALDETFYAKIRDKVPPINNGYETPLLSWREEIFRRFEKLLLEQGLIHPSTLPIKVLDEKIIKARPRPGKIFLLGFAFPAPIETDLLKFLKKNFKAVSCLSKINQEPALSAVSLPNQEEEVAWLSEQVLWEAQHTPLHRIGIVVPNLSQYAPDLSSAFRELIGPMIFEQTGNYNISLGQPLLDQPLIQAGLLPLRFFLEGEPRVLLLSLLLSPYYRAWEAHRPLLSQVAQADRIWRKHSVDAGLDALLKGLVHEHSLGLSGHNLQGISLDSLIRLNQHQQTAAEWVASLEQCWQGLGFPVITLAGEATLYKDLKKILKNLANDLNTKLLDGFQFFAWLKHLLSQTLVNEPGYEQAGIQVLGLIEARGLAFDRLFLAGMSKGSLPQPVRTFPFLGPEERRQVQGATLKSQFDFARIAFSLLKTLSPKMTLTRPQEEKGDPLPPSPFWPAHSEEEKRNYWTVPGHVWPRAEWLKQTLQGIQSYPKTYPLHDSEPALDKSISNLSVTSLETFLACPFKFFTERMLRILSLDEITIGISPLERGEVLHNLMALITKTLRQQAISLQDQEVIKKAVDRCIQEVFKEKAEKPHWQVEKRRLIGEEEGLGGILGAWLEQERERWEEGWRWEREEVSFKDLSFPSWSFSVQGRIDRIDFNQALNEVCCWDYKTGSLPPTNDIIKNFLAPQLPLYLLALTTLPELQKEKLAGFRAGYIGLTSEGELDISDPLKKTSAWEACLPDWEKKISLIGEKLKANQFPADPKPVPRGANEGACTYCSYVGLCTYWKKGS